MKNIAAFIFLLSSSLVYGQESGGDPYAALIKGLLDPGKQAFSYAAIYEQSGEKALMQVIDTQIDGTVVEAWNALNYPISSADKQRLEKYIYQVKAFRERRPSSAKESPYYKKAAEILSGLPAQ
ncbi:hypothetical protein [Pseudoalteromonas mariniglutinosa]|uniref:hypothetical protein n=1 Tax=Pseudoalteromonas mariniglutinosa TaxID=206042 RepID=UPI00384AA85B